MGAWIEISRHLMNCLRFRVAPLVGAWIEILILTAMKNLIVAPLVGAWIEIQKLKPSEEEYIVAPLVGAWIEILPLISVVTSSQSLLSWERGLKCTLITEYWLVKKSLLSWERGLK